MPDPASTILVLAALCAAIIFLRWLKKSPPLPPSDLEKALETDTEITQASKEEPDFLTDAANGDISLEELLERHRGRPREKPDEEEQEKEKPHDPPGGKKCRVEERQKWFDQQLKEIPKEDRLDVVPPPKVEPKLSIPGYAVPCGCLKGMTTFTPLPGPPRGKSLDGIRPAAPKCPACHGTGYVYLQKG